MGASFGGQQPGETNLQQDFERASEQSNRHPGKVKGEHSLGNRMIEMIFTGIHPSQWISVGFFLLEGIDDGTSGFNLVFGVQVLVFPKLTRSGKPKAVLG